MDIMSEEELKGLENWIEKLPISDQHKEATNIFFKMKRSHFAQIIKKALVSNNAIRIDELTFESRSDEESHEDKEYDSGEYKIH